MNKSPSPFRHFPPHPVFFEGDSGLQSDVLTRTQLQQFLTIQWVTGKFGGLIPHGNLMFIFSGPLTFWSDKRESENG